MRTITLAVVACLLLAGCNSPTTATRLGAKSATLIGLSETDATADDAQQVQTIAVMVKGGTGDGFDPDVLHDALLDAIADQFDGQQRLVYLAIADELLLLVLEEIANRDEPITLGEAGVYINAAATGVEQGASLYIAFLEAE